MSQAASDTASAPSNLLLAGLVASGLMALTAYAPALPQIAADLRAPPERVQLTMSVYFMVFAAGQLLGGPLSDRWGRRPVALGGLALFALGSLIGAVSGSVETLLVARVLQALGGASGAVLARSIVKDSNPADRVARALTQVVLISSVVPVIAPVVGGMMAEWLGWRSILWALAVYAAVVFAALSLRLHETAPLTGRRPLGRYPAIYGELCTNRDFMLYSTTAGCFAVGYFGFLSGMPIALSTATGMTTAEFGRWFALLPGAYLVGNAISSRLLRVHDARRMLRAGAIASALGAAAMMAGYIGLPPSPAAVFLPALLVTAGHGMAMSSVTALAMNSATEHTGTAVALMGALSMASAGLGTLLVAEPGLGLVVAMVLVSQVAALLLAVSTRRG